MVGTLSCAFGWIALSAVSLRAQEISRTKDEPLASFEIRKHGDLLTVPMRLEDREMLSCVDTGSSHDCFDSQLRPLLGAPLGTVKIHAGGGLLPAWDYRSPDARFGDLAIDRKYSVMCFDLSHLSEASGVRFQAVLGMATLRRHVVRIDFDEGRLEILAPIEKPPANWGEPIPLTSDDKGLRYFVKLSVGGADRSFLLDTGTDFMGIDETLAAELTKPAAAKQIYTRTTVEGNGVRLAPIYSLQRVSLGNFAHEQILARRNDENALGLHYLARFQVVLDFPNRTLYLKRGNQYERKDRLDMSGLSLGRRGAETVVTNVMSPGPAERAGLRYGDRLERIDDRKISSFSLFELRRLLATEDKRSMRIVFSRGGRMLQTRLVLSDPLIANADDDPEARPHSVR